MKTILEITPRDETHYEMPDEIYEVIEMALALRSARTVKAALAGLHTEMREQVKVRIVCKPLAAGPLRGYPADVSIIDELASFPDDFPAQGVSTIFLDQSR